MQCERDRRQVGLLSFFNVIIMDKTRLQQVVEAAVADCGCFLVDLEVTPDLDITVSMEKTVGDVQMDDCVHVNNAVLDAFDRDVEDYSLTVTSAGLDQPFKVPAQYAKAIGSKVIVHLNGGKKITAVLRNADADGVTVNDDTYPYEDIVSVKYYIDFK